MLSEKVTIDDAKDLFLSHAFRLERRKIVVMSALPPVNMGVTSSHNKVQKNDSRTRNGKVFDNNPHPITLVNQFGHMNVGHSRCLF